MTTLHLHQAEGRVTERERERLRETMARINWRRVWQMRGGNGERGRDTRWIKKRAVRPGAAVGIKHRILLDQSFTPVLVRYVSLLRIPALIQFSVNPFAVMHCNAFSLSFILSSSLFVLSFCLSCDFLLLFYPYSLIHSFIHYLFIFFLFFPSSLLVAAIISSSLLLALIYFLNMGIGGVAATSAIILPLSLASFPQSLHTCSHFLAQKYKDISEKVSSGPLYSY